MYLPACFSSSPSQRRGTTRALRSPTSSVSGRGHLGGDLGQEHCSSALRPLAGIQSAEQQELLARHGPERPVFVEGPFPLWLRSTRLLYYVLRGDPLPPHLRVSWGVGWDGAP